MEVWKALACAVANGYLVWWTASKAYRLGYRNGETKADRAHYAYESYVLKQRIAQIGQLRASHRGIARLRKKLTRVQQSTQQQGKNDG